MVQNAANITILFMHKGFKMLNVGAGRSGCTTNKPTLPLRSDMAPHQVTTPDIIFPYIGGLLHVWFQSRLLEN